MLILYKEIGMNNGKRIILMELLIGMLTFIIITLITVPLILSYII